VKPKTLGERKVCKVVLRSVQNMPFEKRCVVFGEERMSSGQLQSGRKEGMW